MATLRITHSLGVTERHFLLWVTTMLDRKHAGKHIGYPSQVPFYSQPPAWPDLDKHRSIWSDIGNTTPLDYVIAEMIGEEMRTLCNAPGRGNQWKAVMIHFGLQPGTKSRRHYEMRDRGMDYVSGRVEGRLMGFTAEQLAGV